jgi:hypothetical protein
VALANAMSGSLVRYASRLNSGVTASTLLRRYVQASRALHVASVNLQRTRPGSAYQRAAQTKVDLARLQMRTAGGLYQQSQVGQSSPRLLQILAPASPAVSDRLPVIEEFAFGGFLGGSLIGMGLAVACTRRLLRWRPPPT